MREPALRFDPAPAPAPARAAGSNTMRATVEPPSLVASGARRAAVHTRVPRRGVSEPRHALAAHEGLCKSRVPVPARVHSSQSTSASRATPGSGDVSSAAVAPNLLVAAEGERMARSPLEAAAKVYQYAACRRRQPEVLECYSWRHCR